MQDKDSPTRRNASSDDLNTAYLRPMNEELKPSLTYIGTLITAFPAQAIIHHTNIPTLTRTLRPSVLKTHMLQMYGK